MVHLTPNLIVSRRKLFKRDPRYMIRGLMYAFTTPEDTRRLFYEQPHMFYFLVDIRNTVSCI